MHGHYHFIGIGGIGMSALARLLLKEGATVSGSDANDSPVLSQLDRLGVEVHVGHDASQVPPEAVVVVTDAVKGHNPEVAIAERRGQRLMRRSELLGALMSRHEGIAISGTHGKTSTTAMVARILTEAGLDPTVMVGGFVRDLGGNARVGHSRYFVAEACEAYNAFHDLAPRVAVVTNIEPEHLDFHKTMENLLDSFRSFARSVEPGGLLVVNAEDAEAAALGAEHDGRVETFGLETGDWTAPSPHFEGPTSRFTVFHRGVPAADFTLNMPGEHYVQNALAAVAVAAELGVEPARSARALATFQGVTRRFERLGEREGVAVYDDYAHHPTEVRKTVAAAREAFDGRLIVVFQPHLYSRTLEHLDEFIASFDQADEVILTPIYAAREDPLPGVHSGLLVEGIGRRHPGRPCQLAAQDDVPALLAETARAGDVVFVMGAGNIRCAGEAFLELPAAALGRRA